MRVAIATVTVYLADILKPETPDVVIQRYKETLKAFSGNLKLVYKEGIYNYFEKQFASLHGMVMCDWITIAQETFHTKHEFRSKLQLLAHELYLHDADLFQALMDHPMIPLFEMTQLNYKKLEFISLYSSDIYRLLVKIDDGDTDEKQRMEAAEELQQIELQITHNISFNEAIYLFATRSPFFNIHVPSQRETELVVKNIERLTYFAFHQLFSPRFVYVLQRHILMRVFRDSL